VVLIVEDPTVTVKCRGAIKALFLYLNVCLSVMLNNLSCSFTSISFLYNQHILSETDLQNAKTYFLTYSLYLKISDSK
jgi:hypothetical protein